MEYKYINDGKFSVDVCDKNNLQNNKNIYARELLQKKYYKMLLSISHQFIHYNSKYYNPKDDYDKVLNAYEWLSKKMITLCCKFSELNDASLDTFIKSSIYSRYTKIEWYKYDFKNKYKVEEYIPRCIQKLDELHQKVFKLLFRRKSNEQIVKITSIDIKELESMINTINLTLNKYGKSYILNNYINNTVSFDTMNMQSNDALSINKINEAKEVKHIIENSINAISKSYRRVLIMYWGAGMNAQQITSLIDNSNFSLGIDDISINNDGDLYGIISKICKEISNFIKKNYNSYYCDYELSIQKIRNLLKEYYFHLHDQNHVDDKLFYQHIINEILD